MLDFRARERSLGEGVRDLREIETEKERGRVIEGERVRERVEIKVEDTSRAKLMPSFELFSLGAFLCVLWPLSIAETIQTFLHHANCLNRIHVNDNNRHKKKVE